MDGQLRVEALRALARTPDVPVPSRSDVQTPHAWPQMARVKMVTDKKEKKKEKKAKTDGRAAELEVHREHMPCGSFKRMPCGSPELPTARTCTTAGGERGAKERARLD